MAGADTLGPIPVKEKTYIYSSERAMALGWLGRSGFGFWVLGFGVALVEL